MSNLLQGPPPGLPPGGIAEMMGQPEQEPDQDSPLEAVQDAINGMHDLLVTLTDPADVNQAAQAFKILTGLQARLMSQSSQGT